MSDKAVVQYEQPGQDMALDFIEHLEERYRLAQYMVASGMVPQKKPQEAIVVQLKGYELGIPPMMAAANIHVIQGTPTLSAQLMLGLAARRASVTWKVLEHTDTVCRIRFSRPGWEDHTEPYTIEQAQKAGLAGKNNWKTDPRAMLFARCASRGVRAIAPDVLAGQYAYEEMADTSPNGRPAPSGTPKGTLDELNAPIETVESVEVKESPAESEASEGSPGHEGAEGENAAEEEAGDIDEEALDRLHVRYTELFEAARPGATDEERIQYERTLATRPASDADDPWGADEYEQASAALLKEIDKAGRRKKAKA